MATTRFLTYPVFQAFDDNGNPLSGGKVNVYSEGTADRIDTWTDATQNTKNANPVILNSRGEADIWFDAPAKIVLTDSNDVTVKTIDSVSPLNSQTLTGKYNLLENGSFELDGDGDGKPDSWDIVETDGSSTVEIDTSTVAHGSNSLKFVSGSGGGGTATTSEKFPVATGENLGVSFFVASTATTATNKVDVIFYDSAGTNPSTSNVYTSSGTSPSSLTRKSSAVTVPAGKSQAEVKLTGVDNAVTATTYFDFVQALDQGYIFTGTAGEVTASAAELNKTDGLTATTEELNKLDGYTGSTDDLNQLSGGITTRWMQPQLVGNELSLSVAFPAVSAITSTDVAFVEGGGTPLIRTYRFNGGSWSQVGNTASIAASISQEISVTSLNATDVAIVDGTTQDLRTFRFDGTDWAQVGNDLNISGYGPGGHIAALNSTDIALIDEGNDDLRTYRFDGTDWAQVGNDLNISGVVKPAIAALSETDVAFIDGGNDDLRTYRFDGTDWAQVGNDLSITSVTRPSVAALNSTDIAYIDETNDELRIYRFDGTDWTGEGVPLSVSLAITKAHMSALNGTDIAYVDGDNDDLRTYRFGATLSFNEPPFFS